jgi:F-box/leucine-rich repeat protein 2/20
LHTYTQRHVLRCDCRAARQALCKVASSLTSLRLAGCYNVGAIALSALGKGCPKLSDINLSLCSKVDAKGLGPLTAGCTALTALCLRGCDALDDEGLGAIAKNAAQLKSINVSGASVRLLSGPRGVCVACLSCRWCCGDHRSRALCVCGTRADVDTISDRGVATLVRGCRALQQINLTSACRVMYRVWMLLCV